MDWLEELGLEDRVTCDTLDCEGAADSWLRARCCESVLFLCSPCVTNTRKQLTAIAILDSLVECQACESEVYADEWLTPPENLMLTDEEPPC